MADVNGTNSRHCRFLDESYFQSLYETFIAAFSDYVVPFALTEQQFRNHITLNGVDLNRTVGCIEDEKLVGFSLNGFGQWHGRSTVYDAGTGVLPAYRRQGISNAMFELMLPQFKRDGIEQFLLEVVTTNTGALKLYEKLGFAGTRTLALLQCDDGRPVSGEQNAAIEIREITDPDWDVLSTFWDCEPSWQNSIDAVTRNLGFKRILGAFAGDRCVGYIVFSARFGRVAQLAVDREFRRSGVATALLNAMQQATAEGFSLQVINIDKSLTGALAFFAKRGFQERLSQHEMVLDL